jgi:thioredoxin 1
VAGERRTDANRGTRQAVRHQRPLDPVLRVARPHGGPPRGKRLPYYDEAHLRLVGEIRSLLVNGFDLEEIRPFVECLHAGIQARRACPGGIDVYRRKLAELDARLGSSMCSTTGSRGNCTSSKPARGQPRRQPDDHRAARGDRDRSDLRQHVLQAQLPILVDFWAEWCPSCRWLSSIVEDLATEQAGKLLVAEANADENPGLVRRYGTPSLPSLLLFVGGVEQARIIGARPKGRLLTELARFLSAS